MRTLLDGGEVTSAGGRYQFKQLRQQPLPLQRHLPIMIGGSGEKKTLRTVAQYADIWNAFGKPEVLAHKDQVLRAHCADVGRDPAEIERTVGCKITIRKTKAEAQKAVENLMAVNRTPMTWIKDDDTFWTGTAEDIAETMIGYRRVGFNTFICELAAPYDPETLEVLIKQVKPMVEAAIPAR